MVFSESSSSLRAYTYYRNTTEDTVYSKSHYARSTRYCLYILYLHIYQLSEKDRDSAKLVNY